MTVRSNAVLRVITTLLNRLDTGVSDNLCSAVEDYYIEMQANLKREFNNLNSVDPQALDQFIAKLTDLKTLSYMQLGCQRGNRPVGGAPLFRRAGRRFEQVTI